MTTKARSIADLLDRRDQASAPPLRLRTGFCAICTRDSTTLRMRPLGRDDADVGICEECDEGAVRGGSYSFGASVERGLGDGNRRRAAGGAR